VEGRGAAAGRPILRHSEKPPEVRLAIEELMGDVPRIELFARERVTGWAAWGNEVESDVALTANTRELKDLFRIRAHSRLEKAKRSRKAKACWPR